MRDHDKEALESSRPTGDPVELIDFCLDQIYRDTQKGVSDEIVSGLTFEELIGALLIARDALQINDDE